VASTFRLVYLLAVLAAPLTTPVRAQDRTASELVQAEVADCTSRALARTLGLGEWTLCQQRAAEACALSPRTEGQHEPCAEHSRAAWQVAADEIKNRVIQRWQSCKTSDAVKAKMIKAVEDTDAAILALFAANCGYDAAQWRAFDRPDIAAFRSARCLAEGEAARATIHFMNFIRDAGCEAAGSTIP
jgi:hypothetical protein